MAVIDLEGGTGTFCRTLAGGLRNCGDEFEISLLLLRESGVRQIDREIFSGIHVIGTTVHGDWRRFLETPMHAWRLRRAIARIPSDVIFTVGTYANLLVPVVARRRNVILSVHTNMTRQLKGVRFAGVIGRLTRWGCRKRLVIVPAEGVAEDLRENFGARNVKTIWHGVDVGAIRSRAEENCAPLQVSGPYMVACGRLTAQKDYPTLLRAYAEARRRGIGEELVIIGNGPDREALQGLARELGIADVVHFVGHMENPFPVMKGARFFVLSSIWEGFGLVVLEAMALGLPCIATDCPSGPGEILEGGRWGMTIKVGDVQGMADAIARLSSAEDLRQSLAERSRQRAQELSVERMVREYRDVFVGA